MNCTFRNGILGSLVIGNAIGSDPMVTNSDLTAATATWSPVSFRKSDLEVSADGTKILAPISANA